MCYNIYYNKKYEIRGVFMTNNVICMKWGNKFGPEYVNNLYYMVEKNLTIPLLWQCLKWKK